MEANALGSMIGTAFAALSVFYVIKVSRRSIRSCRTQAARRFMIRVAIAMWCVLVPMILVFVLIAFGILPFWSYWTVMIPFLIGLVPAAWFVRRKAMALDGAPAEAANSE